MTQAWHDAVDAKCEHHDQGPQVLKDDEQLAVGTATECQQLDRVTLSLKLW